MNRTSGYAREVRLEREHLTGPIADVRVNSGVTTSFRAEDRDVRHAVRVHEQAAFENSHGT